jgi:hypothetical protein
MCNRPAADPKDTGLDTIDARLDDIDQKLRELDRKLDWIITWITAEQDEIPAPPDAPEGPAESATSERPSDALEPARLVVSLLTGFSAAARMVRFRTVPAALNDVKADRVGRGV